ncbi:U3 small nucleolar RNA-associated protein 24 [Strigomonas culicis]|uniref:U3 small nucleolar RNA-associated protein 24 n=1 Tax=Strigomonas culicis TaxID=28005 RepID=S9UNI1_9TRYP|nr:U3 small nucleolar RNA-associated protein 24 [Strigomonas culicis]|eukprot:EPY30289.1 U3 small nucleolar RNA-associated protein 24 [Strigomonas culicis]
MISRWCPICLWQSLDCVTMFGDVHDGDAVDLSQAPLQLLIARRYYVNGRLRDARHNAIIRVLVLTVEALKSLVLQNQLQREGKLFAELLQLRDDAATHARDHFCEEAVHQAFDNVDLVLKGEVDEVRIQPDPERGSQILVRAQEHVVLDDRVVRVVVRLAAVVLRQLQFAKLHGGHVPLRLFRDRVVVADLFALRRRVIALRLALFLQGQALFFHEHLFNRVLLLLLYVSHGERFRVFFLVSFWSYI